MLTSDLYTYPQAPFSPKGTTYRRYSSAFSKKNKAHKKTTKQNKTKMQAIKWFHRPKNQKESKKTLKWRKPDSVYFLSTGVT